MTTPGGERLLTIGQASTAAAVTPRTLRYYEELGLLRPSSHSVRGARRYSEDDLARIARIRELQQLMGFNLEEIGQILSAEDQLERIRREYRSGQPTSRRRRELLAEAIVINDRLREQVRHKVSRIAGFLEELDAKAVRYRVIVDEIDRGAVSQA
ncbi:MAG: MerR family transcriptional regulator, repressor of the yfmOP operon [Actinomycetota bacterium]|jgi:DNA-binding transcriptional MerR regulator|nr:MerR family transcriptional regulator, repressor of the yfmOP operon [Actinomycetota bacterium]